METTGDQTVPIVIEAGKVRRKRIKALKRGEGKLVAEVADAVDQVRRGLGSDAASKQIIPVVLVYRRKRSKRRDGALRGSCI